MSAQSSKWASHDSQSSLSVAAYYSGITMGLRAAASVPEPEDVSSSLSMITDQHNQSTKWQQTQENLRKQIATQTP